jgi:hypothetical protein
LLLDLLVLLCLYRFARSSPPAVGYAVVGGLLLAGSMMSALSALFLLPVAAVALWPRLFGRRRLPPGVLAVWLWPLGLLLVFAASYLVLSRSPGGSSQLPSAMPYLGRRLGGNGPYFNLGDFLDSANHYTSGLYVLVVLGGALLVVLSLVSRRLGRLFGRRVAAPAAPAPGLRLVLVWLAGPLVAHLFLVRFPLTHWREVFPGLILLAALALAGLAHQVRGRLIWPGVLLAGGLFVATVGHFVYVSWLQPWPEYQSAYPSYRHPLDWNPTALQGGGTREIPPRFGGGVYGAAHHHGWKTVAAMIASGALPAAYDTNERESVSAWYLKQPRECPTAARLYVHAPITPQARAAIERRRELGGFRPVGQVQVAGQPMLGLSLRRRSSDAPRVFPDDGAEWFDRERTSPWAPVGKLYRSESPRRC